MYRTFGHDGIPSEWKPIPKKTRKICGTCKWHEFENIDDGWVCVNDESEYIADWTEHNHSCEEWEKKGSTEE